MNFKPFALKFIVHRSYFIVSPEFRPFERRMPRMSASFVEQRTGPRYMVHVSVRAEWDDERTGEHIVVEGETENIGPQGALVHLERLPDVGSRVRVIVPDAEGRTVEAVAEVLRLERNPVQPDR